MSEIRANNLVDGSGLGSPNFPNGVTVTGILTATSFSGDGSSLTGIDATQIVTGNTSVQTVDTGSNGHIKVNTEGTERARIDSSGRLLIGITSSSDYNQFGSAPILQVVEKGGNDSAIGIERSDGANASDGTLKFRKTRSSTSGGVTAVASGDGIGSIQFFGTDGTNELLSSSIAAQVDNTPGTNDMPGRLIFSTTLDGAATAGEAMRINSNDNPLSSDYDRSVWMSNGATPDITPTHWKLYVRGQSRFYSDANMSSQISSTRKADFEFYNNTGGNSTNSNTWADQGASVYVRGWGENGNPGESSSVLLLNLDWSGATNPGRFIKGYQKATTLVFYVAHSGDVRNSNNSYGAISDEILKQDVVDASSQWDDIKNLRVRKFRFKKDVAELGDEAPTMLGVIAQETELVSPGLVDTPGSYGEEGTEDQELYKTVKYSVLYMKAIKALQEAQERIETLESTVTSLVDRITLLENP